MNVLYLAGRLDKTRGVGFKHTLLLPLDWRGAA
jgi:hypothetical protein